MAKSRTQTRLNSRLKGVATPIALVGKDRKVLFFNQGWVELTGWDADLVLGSICEYTTEGDPQSLRALLGSLCPPPRAFAGETVEGPAFLPRQSGRPVARQLRHIPFYDSAGEVDCVMVIVSNLEATPVTTSAAPAQRLHAELGALRSMLREQFGVSTIVAQSPPMLRAVKQVKVAIQTDSFALLEGDVGTGKEHLARVIHQETSRTQISEGDFRYEAFVPLDCARVLPIDLKRTLRRIFRAWEESDETTAELDRSLPKTVFLQNVDAMPRDVQEFLVTSWSETGSASPLRFIAATTRPLESLVAEDVIREDFFFWISPLRIAIPPLCRRAEDLELLAQAFLERKNVGAEQQMEGFSEEAWTELREYHWPGNLDELALIIGEAAESCDGPVIGSEDLPFRFRMGRDAQSVGPKIEPPVRPLEDHLERVEREQIAWALEAARYNKKKAADLLGLTRAKLYRRMEALNLETETDENGPS